MKQCKDCKFWGCYHSQPGYKGYCLKLTKNADGLQEACKEWKQSPSFRL